MKKKLIALALVVLTAVTLLPFGSLAAGKDAWVRCRLPSCPGYLYVYDKPSDVRSKNIGRIDDDEKITFMKYAPENKNWAYISGYNTYGKKVTGYVHAESITFDEPGTVEPLIMIIESLRADCPGYCYAYDEPSDVRSKNVGRFNDGDEVEFVSFSENSKWILVAGYNTYGKFTCGYIHDNCAYFADEDAAIAAGAMKKTTKKTASKTTKPKATATPAPTPAPVVTKYVTVRSTRPECPGYCYAYSRQTENGENLGRFNDGDVLEYVKSNKTGKWWYVSGYNTRGKFVSGWVHADSVYFNGDEMDETVTVTVDAFAGYCNVYEEADDEGASLGRFNNGDKIEYLHTIETGDWFFVRGKNTKGKTVAGYVRADTVVFEMKEFVPEKGVTYLVINCSAAACPGYCYAYDQPSDMYSENLGRFDNGDIVEYIMTTSNGKYYLIGGVNTAGAYVQGYIHTYSARTYKK